METSMPSTALYFFSLETNGKIYAPNLAQKLSQATQIGSDAL